MSVILERLRAVAAVLHRRRWTSARVVHDAANELESLREDAKLKDADWLSVCRVLGFEDHANPEDVVAAVESLRRELAHRNERLLTFAGIAERLAEVEALRKALAMCSEQRVQAVASEEALRSRLSEAVALLREARDTLTAGDIERYALRDKLRDATRAMNDPTVNNTRSLEAAIHDMRSRLAEAVALLREARPYVKRHEYEPWRNAADKEAGNLVLAIDIVILDLRALIGERT